MLFRSTIQLAPHVVHCTQKHPAPAQPLPHNTTCSTRRALHTEAPSFCTTFTSQYNLLHTSCTAHRSIQLLHNLYLTIQFAPHVVHCTQASSFCTTFISQYNLLHTPCTAHMHPAPALPLPHNIICSTRRALHTGIQLRQQLTPPPHPPIVSRHHLSRQTHTQSPGISRGRRATDSTLELESSRLSHR